jgi:DNA-binding transcriptional LysR family regulator
VGWAYLPRSLVEPLTHAGTLKEIEFENISNQLRLWVDVVWLRDKPLGLGAKRFIELLRNESGLRRPGN